MTVIEVGLHVLAVIKVGLYVLAVIEVGYTCPGCDRGRGLHVLAVI